MQAALDVLCSRIAPRPKYLTLKSILLIDHAKKVIELIEKEQLIHNAREVHDRAFELGIHFGLDAAPDSIMEDYDPVAEIEVDMPYPITDPDRLYWTQAGSMAQQGGRTKTLSSPFGFQRVRLDGAVTVMRRGTLSRFPGIKWVPSPQATHLLESAVKHRWGAHVNNDHAAKLKAEGWVPKAPERILCRIRLRSARIWADTEEGPIYLNAEHLGTNKGKGKRGLLVDEVDPQRAADLDMFIYLMPRKG